MTHTLGIEFGSTRIKAVVIDEAFRPSPPATTPGRATSATASGPMTSRRPGAALRTALRALGEVSVDAMGISAHDARLSGL